jgi:hypothetical protein
MLKTKDIITTLTIVIMVMLILTIFKLPNYRMPGIITVGFLTIMMSTFILKDSTNRLISGIHILNVILPLIFLVVIYVNKKFVRILDMKNVNISNLNMLETIVPIISAFQIGILYGSINNTSTDYIYGSILIGVLNLFTTGLLWREVNFYVTDG